MVGGHGAGTVQHQGELGQGACPKQMGGKEKSERGVRSGEAKPPLFSAQSGGKDVSWKRFKDSDTSLTSVSKWMSHIKRLRSSECSALVNLFPLSRLELKPNWW